jgi:putative Holliday junction resolvase
MRILAIDQGEKRIGLAISDETATIAQPIGYVGSIAEILEVAGQHGAARLVVGYPRRMDGTKSPQTERVEAFIVTLQSATTLPVVKWDERLTTAQAERVLLEGNARRWERREKRDQLAATILLQSYLDAIQNNPQL